MGLYWAQELAKQTADAELAAKFKGLAEALTVAESAIVAELVAVQGKAVEIGGYYRPDAALVEKAMRPSATLNAALASLN